MADVSIEMAESKKVLAMEKARIFLMTDINSNKK